MTEAPSALFARFTKTTSVKTTFHPATLRTNSMITSSTVCHSSDALTSGGAGGAAVTLTTHSTSVSVPGSSALMSVLL